MQLNKGNWVRDNQGVRKTYAHQRTTVDATYVLERLLLLLEVVRGRVEASLRLRQLVLQLLHLLLQLLDLLLRLSGRFWRGSRGVWSSFGAVLEQFWSGFRRGATRFVAFSLRFEAMLVFVVAFRSNLDGGGRMKERKREGKD